VGKGDTREMKVATVKVESAVMGKVGTTVKVGFFVNVNRPIGPGGGIRPPIRRMPSASLTKDQEAMLILTKHPSKKDVYVLMNYYDVVAKKDNPNFKKEVEEAKKYAKVLASPMSSLKSKKAEDRLTAAGLLINRYKTPVGTNTKTEAVPAEESKLILTALAEADWAANTRPGARVDWQMNPQNLFFRLNPTDKDGWKPPQNGQNIAEEAKKWLKDNAGKYKMTRYVRDKVVVETSAEPDK
jgi:hypothetical protein